MNKKQSEVIIPEGLSALANDIYLLNKEIDKAIDNNLRLTQKRLDKELSYKIYQFNKHAKEEFRSIAKVFKIDPELEFDINIPTQLTELKRLKKLKNKAVKKQEYEEAANYRDSEQNEIIDITNEINEIPLTKTLDLSPDSIFKNFSKLIFLKAFTTYYIAHSDFLTYESFSIKLFKLNILHENSVVNKTDYTIRSERILTEVSSVIQNIELHKRLFELIEKK